MSDLLGLLAWALMFAGALLFGTADTSELSVQGFAGSACLILALHAAFASGRREAD